MTPLDCSLPRSSAHEISQAKILDRVAIISSRGSLRPRDRTPISCIGRLILHHLATRKAHPTISGPRILFGCEEEMLLFRLQVALFLSQLPTQFLIMKNSTHVITHKIMQFLVPAAVKN